MRTISLIFLIISFCVPTFANADITSTFDTDLEGWTVEGANYIHRDYGGNPDGHMDIKDNSAKLNHVLAPEETYNYGNLSSYNGGILSFDVRLTSPSPSNYSDFRYGKVTITGSTGVAWIDLINTPSASWTTYTTSLTSTAWNVTGNWADILSDITKISIVLDEGTRGNSSGFDNFAIKATVVPEPISYILFLAGGAALGFRRYTKKKSIN
ncbi:MAG TPA: PEP-CTERM sorting domain-containing protein [Nitrospirae bacterium]|nr:PEP-CTERM sorting domain-containing protein [Nitrospirota bacterium]